MISNVAMQSTDTAPSAPAAAETSDTGAFDALLAIQSQANAQVAAEVESELLADSLEDSAEDSDDDAETRDDALGFISALLTAPKASMPPAAANMVAARASDVPRADIGAISQAAARTGADIDLAQAFAPDVSGKDADLPVFAQANGAAPSVVDGTNWNSLTGPAEMFAHGSRQVSERVESPSLSTHVRDPRWADELGNRLATMVRTGESSASLQLTPVDLGPLEVKVVVRDNQATVHFGAASAETRALLEASIPRLREMLESQGFQLMDSSVSHGFAKPHRHEAAGTPRVDEAGESPTLATRTHITGLLDLYA